MIDYPDFEDLKRCPPLDNDGLSEALHFHVQQTHVYLLALQRLMDRLKAIEAKTESLGKFTLNEEELKKMLATIMGMFRTLEAKLDALTPFTPIYNSVGVQTGLKVKPNVHGHTPPMAPAGGEEPK